MRYSPRPENRKERAISRLSIISSTLILASVLAACGGGAGERESAGAGLPEISEEMRTEYEGWLEENSEEPEDYISGLFRDHRAVLLGEFHRIRHDLIFVQKLMPRLYREGVRFLATEFARRRDQALVDSLLCSPEWNEQLGREVIFRQFMPWGFREYVDILKTAWHLNRDRPAGEEPFRIIALNHTLDFSHFRTPKDWDNTRIWKLVRGNQTEKDWAEAVLKVLNSGEKVLVHCGINHAFTGYRQPKVKGGEFAGWGVKRLGNYLREAVGEEAVTVFLHAPWNSSGGYGADYTYPADGMIDAFMLGAPEGSRSAGFDTAGSPFDKVPIKNAVYMHGYDSFTISDFCDGWIYTRPLSRYRPVTYIEDWISEENLERARENAMNPNWRSYSTEQLNRACMSYLEDFERFFAGLR
ncbi:MAG: hypothetical protein GF417_05035 [Candidatus Latescibacteria bacterium]|nr:hypothetical protein [bacterium]MBD3423783.1 hypothetical protein [Candidatus Latescibacterota bacterium]